MQTAGFFVGHFFVGLGAIHASCMEELNNFVNATRKECFS